MGKFVEIPERLYVRRIHAGSSKGNAEDREMAPPVPERPPRGVRDAVLAPVPRPCRDRRPRAVPVARKVVLLGLLARTMASRRARLLAELAEPSATARCD